jgi:hypothetical protein
MRTKMFFAAMLFILLSGVAGCKNLGSVDGNIINTRVIDGQYQVQVKEFVDQSPADAPWENVPNDKAQSCTVGDPYPQCKG